MAKITTAICLLIAFFWQPTKLTARDFLPLEILYVQTDKQNYFTGENIWFRAYLVNTHTHVQDTTSRYVYAELINSLGRVKNRVMIRHNNGVFSGHIPVTEELEAGSYVLRFFTRHLENFGEEYFFQRIIHIITPESLEENHLSEEIITTAPVQNNDFVVSFHPEGGDIPAGVFTRVAFKAINSSGLGENIQGVVVNERGDTITHIQSSHRGMGSFMLRANSKDRLFAVCRNDAGVEKRFELPRAKEDAIPLQILRRRGNVMIHLPQRDNRDLYVTLQYRGYIIYAVRWESNREMLIIPEISLPTGVIGIVLSDSQGIPLSKRQIFNTNRQETINTAFTTNRDTHGTRERVNATVSITDSENRPVQANFSISVIDNDIAHYDASVNILSTLLLTSELRGHIEDPAYYFMSDNEKATEHLDLVMLTHGWTRFDVSRIYQEETIAVWQDFERSHVITGTLGGRQRRIAEQPVTLIIPQFGFFDLTYTDEEGRFRFDNFEFPEGTEIFIQGRRHTEIQIDRPVFPSVDNLFIPMQANVPVFGTEQVEDFLRYLSDDGIWSEVLDEFVITERRREEPNRSIFSSPVNRRVEREELEAFGTMNLLMAMQFVIPGARSCHITPFLHIHHRGEVVSPRIWVDDIQLDSLIDLTDIPFHTIESIEIVDNASLLGLGSAVALLITTGEDHRPASYYSSHIAIITPLGYQVRREFFAPAYTFPEQRANERPDLRTTIFWNPNVTTREDGSAAIQFYTSDNTGNYVVIIEGITDEGGIVHAVSRFR